MASLGTLASGMAHEVNNPLATVLANVSFAAEQLAGRPDLADAAAALDEARQACDRVARIVRELLAFSETRDESQRLDLCEAAREALERVPAELRKRGRTELALDPAPRVLASPSQVERVLLHLLTNAFQSIPEARAGAGMVRLSTGAGTDGRARVEIRDDGVGIPPDHLAHIFDPFFSTRGVGEGTGLGLAVCHGLVSALSGELEVESTPGKGSLFRVVLPPAGPADGPPHGAERAAGVP